MKTYAGNELSRTSDSNSSMGRLAAGGMAVVHPAAADLKSAIRQAGLPALRRWVDGSGPGNPVPRREGNDVHFRRLVARYPRPRPILKAVIHGLARVGIFDDDDLEAGLVGRLSAERL